MNTVSGKCGGEGQGAEILSSFRGILITSVLLCQQHIKGWDLDNQNHINQQLNLRF